MLPVWMMTTQYEGQAYTFGINGQTGQMVGSLPVDKKKATMQFGMTAGIALIVIELIIFLVLGGATPANELIGILVAIIISAIRVSSLKAAMNTVHAKTTARAYVSKESVKLGRREDNFLYSKTEKREKPKQQSNQ